MTAEEMQVVADAATLLGGAIGQIVNEQLHARAAGKDFSGGADSMELGQSADWADDVANFITAVVDLGEMTFDVRLGEGPGGDQSETEADDDPEPEPDPDEEDDGGDDSGDDSEEDDHDHAPEDGPREHDDGSTQPGGGQSRPDATSDVKRHPLRRRRSDDNYQEGEGMGNDVGGVGFDVTIRRKPGVAGGDGYEEGQGMGFDIHGRGFVLNMPRRPRGGGGGDDGSEGLGADIGGVQVVISVPRGGVGGGYNEDDGLGADIGGPMFVGLVIHPRVVRDIPRPIR